MGEILTDGEVVVLNHARTILREYESRCITAAHSEDDAHAAMNLGRVAAITAQAELGLFDVLNWTSSYNVKQLTGAQVHGR